MIHSTCGIQPQLCDVFNQHPDPGILYHTRAGNHCGFSGYYPWPCSDLGAGRTLLLSPSVQPWDVCLVHLEVSWHGHLQIIQIRSNLPYIFLISPFSDPKNAGVALSECVKNMSIRWRSYDSSVPLDCSTIARREHAEFTMILPYFTVISP